MQQNIAPLIVHHLLTFVTIGLTSGICWSYFNLHIFWLLIIVILMGILTYCFAYHLHHSTALSIGIVILSVAVGSIRYKNQTEDFNKLYNMLQQQTAFDCRAMVESIEILAHTKFQYLLTLTTHTVKKNNRWIEDAYTIQIYTCVKPSILVGDQIELNNLTLKKPTNKDFKTYLTKEKINASFFVPSCKPTLIQRPLISLKRMIATYKNKLLTVFQYKLSPSTFALFSTIFLGKKSKHIAIDLKQKCKAWGISHYLARSGIHLIMFIFIWNLILSIFQCHYRTQSLLLTCIALGYYLLSWSSTSFNRAFFTFLLHQLCRISFLPSHSFYFIMIVCFGTLFGNPYQLFFLDFQLSFGLAITIAWLNYILHQRQQQPLKSP